MTHPSEEDLIGYREGEATEGAAIAEHLRDCDSCRAEFARLNTELTAVFAALEENLNRASQTNGELRLTVPFAYVEGRKPR